MNKSDFLNQVCKQIVYVFDEKAVREELEQHLDDSIEDLMTEGLTYEEAEVQAVLQMGNPVEIGKELNKEHEPLLGYILILLKLVVIALIMPLIVALFSLGMDFIEMSKKVVVENAVNVYAIHREIDTKSYRICIDYICEMEDGHYLVTYRSWRKLSYNRENSLNETIRLESANGNGMYGGMELYEKSFWGQWGFQEIIGDNHETIYVRALDGQKIEIELEEYYNE